MTHNDRYVRSYDADGRSLDGDVPLLVSAAPDDTADARACYSEAGITETVHYDGYGNRLSAADDEPLRFTEPLTGVVGSHERCPCMRHPAVGRWMIEEPVGFAAGEGVDHLPANQADEQS